MIYSTYGFSKGKTTSAIGTTIRALANKEKVLFAQFLKSPEDNGIQFLDRVCNRLDWLTQGTEGFKKEDGNSFAEGIFQEVLNGDYSLVVLDEVLVALDNNLLSKELFYDIVTLCKSNSIDLYLTGRINNGRLRHEIEELSDIATDMRCDRHCYDKLCETCNRSYPFYFHYCPSCGRELPHSQPAKKGREY